jgi:hypothetical protein
MVLRNVLFPAMFEPVRIKMRWWWSNWKLLHTFVSRLSSGWPRFSATNRLGSEEISGKVYCGFK